MDNKLKELKYLKIWESFDDVKVTQEEGMLVITYENQKYAYEITMPGGISVTLDNIVQKPDKNFKISAHKAFYKKEFDLSKERYDDIINKFKNYFKTKKTAPTEIISEPFPNTEGRKFSLILKK